MMIQSSKGDFEIKINRQFDLFTGIPVAGCSLCGGTGLVEDKYGEGDQCSCLLETQVEHCSVHLFYKDGVELSSEDVKTVLSEWAVERIIEMDHEDYASRQG